MRERAPGVRSADIMTDTKKLPLIAGNWKMHCNHFEAIALVQKLAFTLSDRDYKHVEVVVLPPFTDLRSVQTLVDGDKLKISHGAQDISRHEKGAYTGEISGPMLSKLGCSYVLCGHSERRLAHSPGVGNGSSADSERRLRGHRHQAPSVDRPEASTVSDRSRIRVHPCSSPRSGSTDGSEIASTAGGRGGRGTRAQKAPCHCARLTWPVYRRQHSAARAVSHD